MAFSVGSDDAVFENLAGLVGANPIGASAERFDGFLGPSPPRRARLPSSETAAAPEPEHGSEAPAARGFSSLPVPALSALGFRLRARAGL